MYNKVTEVEIDSTNLSDLNGRIRDMNNEGYTILQTQMYILDGKNYLIIFWKEVK